MLAALPVATPEQPGFSFTNLLILAVVIAVLYPVQKKIRQIASDRRKARWARDEAAADEGLARRDRDATGDGADSANGPDGEPGPR